MTVLDTNLNERSKDVPELIHCLRTLKRIVSNAEVADVLEAQQAEISRYHLFAGALLADLNGEELTPAQVALKQTITDDKSKVFTIDDLNAACDAVLKESS